MNGPPPEIRMAQEIARQFAHVPTAEAAQAIATHMEKFWIPAMRRRLAAYVAVRDPDIDELILHAVACLVFDDVDHDQVTVPSGG